MSLLLADVDSTVIALWLGHADVRSTQPYIHADMTIKERALALVTPATVAPGRYAPTDYVLAYLDSLGYYADTRAAGTSRWIPVGPQTERRVAGQQHAVQRTRGAGAKSPRQAGRGRAGDQNIQPGGSATSRRSARLPVARGHF